MATNPTKPSKCGLICTVPNCNWDADLFDFIPPICEAPDEENPHEDVCWDPAAYHKPWDDDEDTFVCTRHKED